MLGQQSLSEHRLVEIILHFLLIFFCFVFVIARCTHTIYMFLLIQAAICGIACLRRILVTNELNRMIELDESDSIAPTSSESSPYLFFSATSFLC